MAVLLGLAASIVYGAADFLGGLSTRRNSVLVVVLLSQALGFALLLAALPLFGDTPLTRDAVIWGGLSGVAGAGGIALLYRGLAIGRMSVVAPITALVGAAAPVLFGLGAGERPSSLAMAGVGLAVVAAALVSAAPDPATRSARGDRRSRFAASGVREAVGAGLCIGAFLILLDQSGDDTGAWPLVAARVASIGVFLVAALVARRSLRPAPGSGVLIAGAGSLDVTANVLYLLGSRLGLLSIVAVLTSLYPASTVVLARTVLRERLGRLQLVGLACAAAGVVLITLG